jgi:hypothetical protein
MFTDETVIGLLKESFDADTRTVAAHPELSAAVHSQLRRRRVGQLAVNGATLALAGLVTAGIVVGQHHDQPDNQIASGSNAPSGVDTGATATNALGSKTVKLSSFEFKVPAQATVTKTCLPGVDGASHQGELFGLVSDASGKILNDAAGNPCVGATIQFTKNSPAATSQVMTPGQPTVYITTSAAGTQAGYIKLDGRDSARAALAVGGTPGKYVMLMTIPSDNDQSVLVAALRQYSLTTH